MTRDLNVDHVLDNWFTEGPTNLPDRTVAAIAEQLDHVQQRGALGLPRRLSMPRFVSALAGAAVLVVVVALALGIYVNSPRSGIGGQPTPSVSPEITELLNGFLAGRVAGVGAEQYMGNGEEVPLLYATTSGVRYERGEFEPILGIEWPYGNTAFKVRVFAGDAVVEQLFFLGPDSPRGLTYAPDGFATHIAPTTEDGQPVAESYTYFDGAVTLSAAHPWVLYQKEGVYLFPGGRLIPEGSGVRPTTDGGERHDWDQLEFMADPTLVGTDCQVRPDPADAQALVTSIASEAGVNATDPVAVTVGDIVGVMIDVKIAAGASVCWNVNNETGDATDHPGVLYPAWDSGSMSMAGSGHARGQATGDWMRLYLFDAPERSSIRMLAVVIIAPESSFERAVNAAAPVVDSIEFHEP